MISAVRLKRRSACRHARRALHVVLSCSGDAVKVQLIRNVPATLTVFGSRRAVSKREAQVFTEAVARRANAYPEICDFGAYRATLAMKSKLEIERRIADLAWNADACCQK